MVAGKEADIPKFPAEDCKMKKMVRDWAKEPGPWTRTGGFLSVIKTIDFAVEPLSGSAM